jgi:signal transduction histidine kinase
LLAGLRGYPPGYIVCVASVSWIVSILLLPLRNLGILESSWITDYGFQIGSAMEAILLALAQAYRISLIKKESADIQRQLLKISQQAEYELEAKVQLRTAELDDAVQRMKLLDKEKDDILGIAAHDLKNPLTSIIGMSDLLRKMRHQISEEQQHQYLERISNSGQRMMHIVTNLLDVNALESGHFHLSAETVDFGQLLRDIIQQYESALKAKNLHTVVDIDGSVFVTADLNACIRILITCLSNAIKFSPAGKTIWLTISQHNGMGRFEVRDEGPGLSGEDQQHLFTKFSKLSPTPTAGEHSSGLGLSIVKKLSEAQDGCVRCVSTLGAGTSFMVELPLAAVSPSQVQVLTGT